MIIRSPTGASAWRGRVRIFATPGIGGSQLATLPPAPARRPERCLPMRRLRIPGRARHMPLCGDHARFGLRLHRHGGNGSQLVRLRLRGKVRRQESMRGQVGPIGATHHLIDVGVARIRLCLGVDKAAVIVLQLLRHRHARMRRVLLRAESRTPHMVHGVGHARMHIGMAGPTRPPSRLR